MQIGIVISTMFEPSSHVFGANSVGVAPNMWDDWSNIVDITIPVYIS